MSTLSSTDLNPQQQAIVDSFEGPVLTLATVGSGKTRVLAHRAARALDRYRPRDMLVLTFTNKAATEMRERIVGLVGNSSSGMHVSTFHGFCALVLREEAKTLALSPSFTIYDDEDQKEVVRSVLRAMGGSWMGGEEAIQDIKNLLSDLKRRLVYPSARREFMDLDRETREGYRRYQEVLDANDALDFDDLIARTALLFQSGGPRLEMWR